MSVLVVATVVAVHVRKLEEIVARGQREAEGSEEAEQDELHGVAVSFGGFEEYISKRKRFPSLPLIAVYGRFVR